jgi:hypothetical protein
MNNRIISPVSKKVAQQLKAAGLTDLAEVARNPHDYIEIRDVDNISRPFCLVAYDSGEYYEAYSFCGCENLEELQQTFIDRCVGSYSNTPIAILVDGKIANYRMEIIIE